VILKFWLNVSKREQRERLLERIDEPDKHWKFNSRDVDERERWDDYLDAYEQALNATSRPWAPWYVVPADEKPYLRWQVAKLVNETFDALDLEAPRSDEKRQAELERAKERLLAERD
jgi:polyphosphate kinase 2 (PPK2 family)